DAGKLRILAFTARERAAAVPDVPTAGEAGVPDLTIEGLVGVFGPRNVPDGAVGRIANDVRTLLTDSTMVSRLTATGQVVNFGTAAEFTAAIDFQRTQAGGAGKGLGKSPAQGRVAAQPSESLLRARPGARSGRGSTPRRRTAARVPPPPSRDP